MYKFRSSITHLTPKGCHLLPWRKLNLIILIFKYLHLFFMKHYDFILKLTLFPKHNDFILKVFKLYFPPCGRFTSLFSQRQLKMAVGGLGYCDHWPAGSSAGFLCACNRESYLRRWADACKTGRWTRRSLWSLLNIINKNMNKSRRKLMYTHCEQLRWCHCDVTCCGRDQRLWQS